MTSLPATRRFCAKCLTLFTPRANLVLVALASLVASLFLILGLIQFPGMHTDADLFIPTILNVASDKGWIVNGYTPMLFRQAGDNAYAGHGFLYPFIVGSLLKATTGKAIYLWSGVTNASAVLMYSFIGYFTCPRRSLSTLLYAVLLGICAGVIGIALQGRPEQLALLFIPVPLLAWRQWRRISLLNLSSFVTIAILSAISPLLGLYLWLAFTIALAHILSFNTRRYFISQLVVIAASFTLYSLAINLITGSTIIEYINKILLYGRSPFIQGYTILQLGSLKFDAPLWPLPLLIIALLSVYWLLSNRLLSLLFLIAIPPIYIAKLVGAYIYLPFVPTAILLLSLRIQQLRGPTQRAFKYSVALFLCLYFLILARHLALASLYLQGNNTYVDTREKINRIQAAAAETNSMVGYGLARFPSLAVFGSADRELIGVDARSRHDWAREGFETLTKKRIAYIIVPQEGQSDARPPALLDGGNFMLIENYWTSSRSRLFGLKLGGYDPGYHIAIYQKRES